jgi:hypothetical protein
VNNFSFAERENDQYRLESRSRLFVDGTPTDTWIPGLSIIRQFEIPIGYLLVTDYDCPFEEITNFILLTREHQIASRKSIGPSALSFAPNISCLLEHIEWKDSAHFTVNFEGQQDEWHFTIRDRGIPVIYPMLKMVRVSG